MLTGLAGSIVGFAAGTAAALRIGPRIFELTAGSSVRIEPALLCWSLIAAPLLAAIASFIPAMIAVTRDPAELLTKERL